MSLDVEIVCPLGCECEKAVDGKLQRCAWYVELEGEDPQNGEKFRDWKCAIAWEPVLLVNSSLQMQRVSVGVETFRNETIKRQDAVLNIAGMSVNDKESIESN